MDDNKGKMILGRGGRRKFLTHVAGAGTGFLGLNRTVGADEGDTDQKPIVWTRDQNGEPDVVRYISGERHRRLMVYKNLNINNFLNKHPSIYFISMGSQPGEQELMLELFVSERRNSLPEEVDDVPTVINEIDTYDHHPECREGEEYDTLRSNIGISVDRGDGTHGFGTIGLIGYNAHPDNPYECIVTAYHVVEDRTNNEMYQPEFGDIAGYQRQDDEDMDTTKYKAARSADVGATEESSQEDITGTWDFAGLTDATDGDGSVDAVIAGKETCSDSATCIGTARDDDIDYRADYKGEHGVDGDSGSPYVDQNGKLVSLHYGETSDGENRHSVGPVGSETIDRLDVTLTDPSNVE